MVIIIPLKRRRPAFHFNDTQTRDANCSDEVAHPDDYSDDCDDDDGDDDDDDYYKW